MHEYSHFKDIKQFGPATNRNSALREVRALGSEFKFHGRFNVQSRYIQETAKFIKIATDNTPSYHLTLKSVWFNLFR